MEIRRPPRSLRRGMLAMLVLLAAGPAAANAQRPDVLPDAVRAALASPVLERAHVGLEVIDVATGESLARLDADRLFIPASSTKLVVAAAAAHYLPHDFSYATTLHATGDVRDGVLHGDLIVRGSGDPTISGRYHDDDMFAVWDALADSLRAAGVNRVAGRVVADESAWDTDYTRGDWEAYDLLWWYAAPVGALGFNDNSIDFRREAAAVGQPVRITGTPASRFYTLVNRSRTVAAGSPNTFDFMRVPGTDTIIAYGELPADAAVRTEYFAVVDPARYAATVFAERLERAGIDVGNDTVHVLREDAASRVALGSARLLVTHRSGPLPQVIRPVLQTSQNWFAEQLLKTIARDQAGMGSWGAGLRLEQQFLVAQVGIDSSAFRLRDASGLSAGNLLTPAALAGLARYIATEPRMQPARDALPVAGASTGSLRTRLTDLSGRVTAKTGSISNVDSLTGLLTTDSGRRVAFAIVANNTGQSSARVRAVIDDVVRALAKSL